MKILCAPDSFKETLTAAQAAAAMVEGIQRADPSIVCESCPVADGGEGTMDALISAMGGTVHRAAVLGPLGENINARYGVVHDRTSGVVELAEASGLARVPHRKRNPMKTTTYGTGQLIRLAADQRCGTVIVCIGGSATVDGATGIAQALGAKFYDRHGRTIIEPMTGGRLLAISRYDPSKELPAIRVACDVTNPLCGPSGAAAVYGPQKGATPEQVRQLDEGLAHLASIVGGDPKLPGSGAAGGAGFGLVNMCGGQLARGIDLVLEVIGFHERCRGASLVLTGEGRLDAQSLHGKACLGVAKAAATLGVPTIAIVGSTGPGADLCTMSSQGGMLQRFISLSDRFGFNRAMTEAPALVAEIAAEIVREFKT